MAKLKNLNTLEDIFLLPEHIFGRNTELSNTYLNHPKASRIHAVITWHDQQWYIKDNSTNGTFINGKRTDRGLKVPIHLEDQLTFACENGNTWQLVDASAPSNMLIPITPGLPTYTLDRLLALPDEKKPETTIYMNSQGDWMCETQQETTVLRNNSIVGTNATNLWRFVDANPTPETATDFVAALDSTSSNLKLILEVSRDEEHASLVLKYDCQYFDLGEREHHQVLLHLARKCLSDQKLTLHERDIGWIDRNLLAKNIGIDDSHLNVQLYRIRKQLVPLTTHIPQIASLIERRPREIRLNHKRIEIHGGQS